MQRSDRAGGFVRSVKFVGIFQGIDVDRDHRVDVRPFFVEGFDTIQISLHHLAAGELAGFVTGVNVVDGRFDGIEIDLSHVLSPCDRSKY